MLSRIKHLFQRFGVCSKAYPGNVKEFGLKVAVAQFWDVLIPTGKSKKYIDTLSGRVNKELMPLAQQYDKGDFVPVSPKMKLDKTPVWICWWQGEEQMPPIVKACVHKMRSSLPQWAQLHIITWDNLPEYIDLPDYIIQKYQQGLITNIHLTDILRYGLTSHYGGAWIDSTVMLSDRIVDKLPQYLKETYFTQRFSSWDECPQEACRGKWCNFFFMGEQNCILFRFVYDALLWWWQNHNRLIDYVIVDYVIWAGYEGVKEIRNLIDAVPSGNKNIWLLAKHLNDAYSREGWDAILDSNDFFKLSYKGYLETNTSQGEKTIYAHILEETGVG